jgi:hypothetical protein
MRILKFLLVLHDTVLCYYFFNVNFSEFRFAPLGRAGQPCFNLFSRGVVEVMCFTKSLDVCRRIHRHLHIIVVFGLPV